MYLNIKRFIFNFFFWTSQNGIYYNTKGDSHKMCKREPPPRVTDTSLVPKKSLLRRNKSKQWGYNFIKLFYENYVLLSINQAHIHFSKICILSESSLESNESGLIRSTKRTWIKIGEKGHDIVEEGSSLGYLSYPKMIIGQG